MTLHKEVDNLQPKGVLVQEGISLRLEVNAR